MRVKAPTIHLNGTSAASLLRDLNEARTRGHLFRHELAMTMPNGRDFYPQESGALLVAMDEHYKRLRDIDAVLRELDDIVEQINDQLPDNGRGL